MYVNSQCKITNCKDTHGSSKDETVRDCPFFRQSTYCPQLWDGGCTFYHGRKNV
jgi:hypothetical protein